VTRHQTHNLLTANKSFENMEKSKYLANVITNQNDIHEELKTKLNSGNAWCHSFQSLLYSRLLSKNLKIKMYKATIIPPVLYGCGTLRVFRNKVLRKYIWT
jgi:hypothetical protein